MQITQGRIVKYFISAEIPPRLNSPYFGNGVQDMSPMALPALYSQIHRLRQNPRADMAVQFMFRQQIHPLFEQRRQGLGQG